MPYLGIIGGQDIEQEGSGVGRQLVQVREHHCPDPNLDLLPQQGPDLLERQLRSSCLVRGAIELKIICLLIFFITAQFSIITNMCGSYNKKKTNYFVQYKEWSK